MRRPPGLQGRAGAFLAARSLLSGYKPSVCINIVLGEHMSTYAIKADAFYLPTRVARDGYLMVEDGVFGEYVTEAPDCEIRDYSGCEIAPGYVDTHIHGFDNHDIMDCESESVAIVSRGILRNGVTSYLPPRSPRAPSSSSAPALPLPSTSRLATRRRTPASRASSSRAPSSPRSTRAPRTRLTSPPPPWRS